MHICHKLTDASYTITSPAITLVLYQKRHLHPELKLIRILSEENLKERVTHSQISPSFDVSWIILFAHNVVKTERVIWRGSCFYLPPTTSSPPSYCLLFKCHWFSVQLFRACTSGALKMYYYICLTLCFCYRLQVYTSTQCWHEVLNHINKDGQHISNSCIKLKPNHSGCKRKWMLILH